MHLYGVARKATVFFNKQFKQYIGIVNFLKLMFWTKTYQVLKATTVHSKDYETISTSNLTTIAFNPCYHQLNLSETLENSCASHKHKSLYEAYGTM